MAEERIGRYRILEEIASGAQGTVYRAFDPDSGGLVALKVLHPSLTGDASYLERFQREASLAASIDHPNVVRIFEVGEADGRHFMALEFLPENVARLMESGGLSNERAASLAAQIADGLRAAHSVGVVHRDIKPANVLIAPDGTAKVTDFGIARAEALATMTATGVLMGTPHYMSPEQASGERADPRSDLYSLGCMLYQMLSGELPFKGATPIAVVHSQIYDDPKPIREVRPGIPRKLAGVVRRAMQKDPARRFQSAQEMAGALRDAVPSVPAPLQAATAAVPGADRAAATPAAPPERHRWRVFSPLNIALLVTVGVAGVIAFVMFAQAQNGSRVTVSPAYTMVPRPTTAPVNEVARIPEPTLTAMPVPTRAPALVPTDTEGLAVPQSSDPSIPLTVRDEGRVVTLDFGPGQIFLLDRTNVTAEFQAKGVVFSDIDSDLPAEFHRSLGSQDNLALDGSLFNLFRLDFVGVDPVVSVEVTQVDLNDRAQTHTLTAFDERGDVIARDKVQLGGEFGEFTLRVSSTQGIAAVVAIEDPPGAERLVRIVYTTTERPVPIRVRSLAGQVTAVNVSNKSFTVVEQQNAQTFTVIVGIGTEFIRTEFPFDPANPPDDMEVFELTRTRTTIGALRVGDFVFVRSSHPILAGESVGNPISIQVLPP